MVLTTLAGAKENIKKIIYATDAEYDAIKPSLTSANVISLPNNLETYAWYSNNNIYYYSEAASIVLNADCLGMFSDFNKVSSIDTVKYETSNVTTLENMFNGATNLTSLNVTNFDVKKVSSMKRMFASCESLTTLDLSSFEIVHTTTMEKMFSNMYALQTIYVTSAFDTTPVTTSNGMFVNDTNLVGGNGTVFDSNHDDKAYAVIDTALTPGYFTQR